MKIQGKNIINMTNKYVVNLIWILVAFLFFYSCETDDSYDYSNEIQPYEGSTLDYLEANEGVYDSLLVVINRVPGLRETLHQDNITLFAVPNESFENVLNELNKFRGDSLAEPVYLENLNRADLDTLISRYVFEELIEVERIKVNRAGLEVNSYKYEYPMNIAHEYLDASGHVENGSQRLIFSDLNNSVLTSNWTRSYAESMNIETNNGLVYKLSSGHNFGFEEFVFRFNKIINEEDE